MALTQEERQRVRYHLGYGAVQPAAMLTFGMVKPYPTAFLVEQAMDQILPVAEDKCRQLLTVLDGVECRLVDAQTRLAASSIDQLKMRADEPERLEDEYRRWGYRLADLLMVPVYPYSTRYFPGGRGAMTNVSVVR